MFRIFIILALCVLPSIAVLYYIYQKDKIEKEPAHLLALLFVEGIVCATIALIVPKVLIRYVPYYKTIFTTTNVFGNIFKNLVLIAAFQEIIKWVINYSTIWKNKNFNHVYDSIVYSTFIAIGFATYDCIIYSFENANIGIQHILSNILTTIPIHAVLGIFMGYYFALAKKEDLNNNKKVANKYKFYSLGIPIIFHFIYNLCLVKRKYYTFIAFIIYIVILYIEAIRSVNELSKVETMLDNSSKKNQAKDNKDEININELFELPKKKDDEKKNS